MTARITIAQLYPELLGVTGDRGNVDVLRIRAQRAGLDVDVVLVEPGDELPAADVIVIGNGPLSALRSVAADARRHTDALSAHIAAGGALLAIGGGAELLGHEISGAEGSLAGLGVLPLRVERRNERRVGYVVAEAAGIRLAGFEDHSSVWLPDPGVQAFARVIHGKGTIEPSSGGPRGEGVRVSNAYALRVQGPLLPLNPALADQILATVADARGTTYEPSEAHAQLDAFAQEARAAIESRATQTYNSIGI
ncbi:hypothetical protein AB1K54_10850 [Microbacterium sp. BWT-B31]|uniref:hypothetical protein n=1 Tax=Microbacterium sp. BWT-B31 TaxID=3232072 RepID=UPI003529627C